GDRAPMAPPTTRQEGLRATCTAPRVALIRSTRVGPRSGVVATSASLELGAEASELGLGALGALPLGALLHPCRLGPRVRRRGALPLGVRALVLGLSALPLGLGALVLGLG